MSREKFCFIRSLDCTRNLCYTVSRTEVDTMDEIKIGKYRHFKGNEYKVLYIAKHSESLEDMVVYQALYGDKGVWVRPASMWNDTVERDGKTYRRFTFIED